MQVAVPLVLALAASLAALGCDREASVEAPPPPPLKEVPSPPALPDVVEQPAPEVRSYPTGVRPDDPHLAAGYEVYRTACMVCHDRGVSNAPMITDLAEWRTRIAKGKETLYRNAINGYTGKRGFMPPKGGSPASWSDEQVRAAVDYIVYTVNRQTRD